jgi:ATP-dependent DNA helicase RecQ
VRVVVVSKTRLGQSACVGAHDLDDFRSLRLFKHDQTYLLQDAQIEIGDVLELEYRDRPNLQPPHIEDVLVAESSARRIARQPDLARLIRERDTVWESVPELFDGRLRFTPSGSAYVSAEGPFPTRSTGYWLIDNPLTRFTFGEKVKYRWDGEGQLRRMPYVGLAESVESIPAGTLVRLSLSRPNAPPGQPRGCWLQLSGWYLD